MSIYTKENLVLPDTFIGDWTYGLPAVTRGYAGCKLTIGKFCSIGANVQFAFWGRHQMNDISTYPFNNLSNQGWPPVSGTLVEGEDINVSNDVWFANNSLILQGAVIEDGAVIGAHSVVGGHVRAYSVVVGNPAKEIKRRFSDDQVNKLLEMKWWNWDIEKIKQYLQFISSPRIDDLYDTWKRGL